jgi:hypothetical protein
MSGWNQWRCRPGDLCIVVKGQYTHNIGRVVRVIASMDLRPFGRVWSYQGALVDDFGGLLGGVADDCLRPIRDPGLTATDETLAWKPVPTDEQNISDAALETALRGQT